MQQIIITGICCDHNSTFMRGPASAPVHIHRALYSGSANLFSESGVDLEKRGIVDGGDHFIEETDEAYLGIADIITPMLAEDSKMMIVGGDHSITFPVIRAFAEKYTDLSILHFDAHPDLYDDYEGNKYAHACPFASIMENKLVKRLIQVGIRTLNDHQKQQAEKYGVEIYQMKDIWRNELALSISSPLYISFDMDVLDPACAPGVSHHEPGGMSVREVLDIVQSLDCQVVGADIVEYNPKRDINEMTAMVAAKLVKEICAKM